MSQPRNQTLSSKDPSCKPIAVRLPSDLPAAVDAACEEHGITQSEFLRGLVSQWVYGRSQLSGPDEGYAQARSMAAQLAHAALRQSLENLPESHEAASTMLQGYYTERSSRRKR